MCAKPSTNIRRPFAILSTVTIHACCVGPCSIHDVDAAKEYAQRLKVLSDDIADQIFVVMRAYFEKPEAQLVEGLINDPHLNDSFKVAEGLHIGRRLLLELSQMGLPLATEALDPITLGTCRI